MCIKGEIHKIPELTSSIKLDNVYQIFTPITSDDQSPMTILIESHPGIGKTSLAKEICLQWGNNKLITSDMLRDPIVQELSSSLMDLMNSVMNCVTHLSLENLLKEKFYLMLK